MATVAAGDRQRGPTHVTVGFRLAVLAPRDRQAARVGANQQQGPRHGPCQHVSVAEPLGSMVSISMAMPSG